jgi:hypothetical protein
MYVKKNWSEEDLPLIEYVEGGPEAEGHILLVDFMSGNVPTVFGKVLCKVSEYDGADYIRDITTPNDDDTDNLMHHFTRCFSEEITGYEIKLMMIKHYS